MSALFNGSSQHLLNSTVPVTDTPFTVGMWVYPTDPSGTQMFFSSCTNTDSLAFGLIDSTGLKWGIAFNDSNNFGPGAVTLNQWAFCVARFISISNRRLTVLEGNGTITGVQHTAAGSLLATKYGIGARVVSPVVEFFGGRIAEFWMTDTDIQPDGTALNNDTLRQLAHGGPFSMPHVAANLVDYRSLRTALSSDQDNASDYFNGNSGRQTWTNLGATRAAHPPLAAGYKQNTPPSFLYPYRYISNNPPPAPLPFRRTTRFFTQRF